ncbi:MAG: tellurite resistance protein TerC [Alphaproteobacteria bacterium]|jgi:tellurite resistance protein TerC
MIPEFLDFVPTHWVLFLAIIISLLAFDLGVFFKRDRELSIKESLGLTSLYIIIGLSFGFIIMNLYDPMRLESCAPNCNIRAAGYYWNAFIIEKVLSMDNIFVMSVIFSYLKIPRKYQHRVLFWGILGVILMRGLMILVGTTLITEFSWLLYVFGLFLVYTGFKMLFSNEGDNDISESKIILIIKKILPITNDLHGNRFFIRLNNPKTQKLSWFLTPLMTALICIELIDVVFAIDSVPAVFSITLDPFIVYTSNIFAILGLRALYSALDAVLEKFKYLEPALAVVLMFIGSKIFIADFFGMDKFPMEISLSITVGLIALGIIYSIFKNNQEQNS